MITNNIMAQCQYKKTKTRIVETTHPDSGKVTFEEETQYELNRKSEHSLKHMKDMRPFYQQFLFHFTHGVLLDRQFLLQRYHVTQKG